MKKTICHILFFIFGMLFTIRLNAQILAASLDKDTILIGEQLKLTLSVKNLPAKKFSVLQWFQFPDTIRHFEIIDSSNTESIIANEQYNYRQTITITSFDSGRWTIPSLKVLFKNNHTNKSIAKQTLPIMVQVLPADVSNVKDYHDVKDILQVHLVVDHSGNKIIIAIALALLILLMIIWWHIKRRKKNTVIEKKAIQDPHNWAMKQLSLLEKQQLSNEESVKKYYDQLYHICRHYFFLEFSKPVMYQTTSEWVSALRALPINQKLKTDFCDLLFKIDKIRFKKESIGEQKESKEIIMEARKIINAFDKIKPVQKV